MRQDGLNRFRRWSIGMARQAKWLFARAIVPKSRFYRWLLRDEEGRELSLAGEYVLADLRRFCFADRGTIFHSDPHEMARREGRREVFVRIVNFLNLDEASVQQLMELDDGE